MYKVLPYMAKLGPPDFDITIPIKNNPQWSFRNIIFIIKIIIINK